MRKATALFLCLGLSLTLQADEKLQLYATTFDTNETVSSAENGVLILYKDSYLSADRAVYNRQDEVLELHGHVMVLKGADYYMLGRYARFDLRNDSRMIAPFYMLEKERRVWMSCTEVDAQGVELMLSSGVISGCDPDDPIWQFRFSDSDYDTETKWLNLYNARILIGGVPVFYLPYFGYSLDTTRKTGLLVPSMGLSDSEGLYYEQPVYIAEDNWWDLELRPQIRTQRGQGLYGEFRFIDSKVSSGHLVAGYFKEISTYAEENGLANARHYGMNFHYENTNVLKQWWDVNTRGQSAAYFDINLMNDIEYINLAYNDNTKNATTSQVYSRVNLIHNLEHDYFGLYFKYFLDLEQENNDETIQNLPTFQYHKYLETWFDDLLFYNVNLNINNYYRRVGVKAQEAELGIPVTIQGALFDNYVDVSYSTSLYGKYTLFDGADTDIYHSGGFSRNTNTFQIGTHLTKGYESIAHVVGLDVMFVRNGFDIRNGYFEAYNDYCDANPNSDECGFYKITDIEEATKLQFSQYLVDTKGSQILYHRLSQSISSTDSKLGEMENEFEWQVTPRVSAYSDTIYDHEKNGVTKQLTSLRYSGVQTQTSLSHVYEDKDRRGQTSDSNYLTVDARYHYSDHYSYFGKYAFDIENQVKKNAEIGFLYTKRCWDFGLRYVEHNRPILRSGGVTSSIYDKYIYLTIALNPIGGNEASYQLNNHLEGL